MKIYMVSLFHRATIKKKPQDENTALFHRATITSTKTEARNLVASYDLRPRNETVSPVSVSVCLPVCPVDNF